VTWHSSGLTQLQGSTTRRSRGLPYHDMNDDDDLRVLSELVNWRRRLGDGNKGLDIWQGAAKRSAFRATKGSAEASERLE
jgi:hypothetical protein